MRLNHLSFTNFRNYVRLELGLAPRLTIFQGSNAQGKTNLLEAVHLLATGRSPRVGAERELINWLALESPLPYARLVADVGEGRTAEKLELVLELGNGGIGGPVVRKQVRINGVAKRALDLIGRLRVVLFLPEDVSLVAGAPAERRRYLDIALCQIDPAYTRALSEYGKVLAQRNALLKRLRDEGGERGQLAFWDDQVAQQGSYLIWRRAKAVCMLEERARVLHRSLSGGQEHLKLVYLPSPGHLTAQTGGGQGSGHRFENLEPVSIAGGLVAQLRATRDRDVAAGTSLSGPHRDDLQFLAEGRELRIYGSRGQQRTAALSVKLAEVGMMREVGGESPLLLLDDVMSELDATRRHALLDALEGVDQALATTTDWADFTPELLSHARRIHVEEGRLSEA